MAKMFYTLEETKAALSCSEEEIKQFSAEGRLREFRDGPRSMYKADQVELLKNEMSYKVITVYCAHGDGGERGRGPIFGVFTNKVIAADVAKGQGWYGGDGEVSIQSALRTPDGKYWLLAQDKPIDISQKAYDEKLREATLSVLTDEQKRVLGIKV